MLIFLAIPNIFGNARLYPSISKGDERYSRHFFPITVIIVLLAGHCLGTLCLCYRLAHLLPKDFENKILLVKGNISSVPDKQKDYSQFAFTIDTINGKQFSGKVLLSWYNYHHSETYTQVSSKCEGRMPVSEKIPYSSHSTSPSAHPLCAGQRWQLKVKLKRPRGFSNPGSFDYEGWMFEQNIIAKGYVVADASNQLVNQSYFNYPIEQFREKLLQYWEPFYSQWPFLGVLLGLTIGITYQITNEQWQTFMNTGTIHIISISGFHMSMMSGAVFWVINFIWRRIPRLCMLCPAKRAAAAFAFFMALFYSGLAGFSIPTQRSLITISVFMGALFFQKKTRPWQCWSLSLIGVLILDPFAPLNISFWLSFSAVGIILYLLTESAVEPALWKWIKWQIRLFIGLVPFSLFWFNQVSIGSLWSNMIAIPVVGFITLPSSILAILLSMVNSTTSIWLMHASHWSFSLLFNYLDWVNHHNSMIIIHSLNAAWMLLLGLFGIVLLLAPKGWPCRWLGLIYWIPLCFPGGQHPNYGEAQIDLLDVGQGLATVVQTQHHVLVFDTGPRFSPSFDTGKAVVLPYLRTKNIKYLDALIISHSDIDHSGGLYSVLSGIPVKKVFLNDKRLLSSASLCSPDVHWQWDGVSFQFFTQGLNQFSDTNNTSCVLKISTKKHSALLPGDLEKKGEKVLLSYYGDKLKADLLIAGHHGSLTSSSQDWINRAAPKYVLFATGYLNRYHFPNPVIVQRYTTFGTSSFSTADCGMISWILTNTDAISSPSCYRLIHQHPWYS